MDKDGVLDQFANVISHIFHPFVIIWPLGFLFLGLNGLNFRESLRLVLLVGLITVLPLFSFISASSNYSLRKVNDQKHRNILYTIAISEGLILIGVAKFFLNSQLLYLMSIAVFATIIVGALVNRFVTKVSIHVGIISGFAAAIAFLSALTGAVLLILTALVGWARLRQKRHTPEQVVVGFLIPSTIVSAVYLLAV